jgi:hypothetical protein
MQIQSFDAAVIHDARPNPLDYLSIETTYHYRATVCVYPANLGITISAEIQVWVDGSAASWERLTKGLSAWGHLPFQGLCGDAAAARRRCVLFLVGGFALQKKDLVVILCFVEVLSVIVLL